MYWLKYSCGKTSKNVREFSSYLCDHQEKAFFRTLYWGQFKYCKVNKSEVSSSMTLYACIQPFDHHADQDLETDTPESSHFSLNITAPT